MLKFLLVFILCLLSPPLIAETLAYNIILILSDQEPYRLADAKEYELPARKKLQEHGVTFLNHYTAAAMCSPSRATLLTGLPPEQTKIVDQMEYFFINSLNPAIPTMGSVLKKLGYETAYFGKFEMNKNLLQSKNTVNYSTLAKAYGFDEFNFNGDVGGTPQQGYQVDSFFVGEAVQWLRTKVDKKKPKPFFLVVSLLNPHDIMYGDANIAGTPKAQKPLAPVILPPPDNLIYKKHWNFKLPYSLDEDLNQGPPALIQYQKGWAGALGFIPVARKDMWHEYYNYYLNALRDNDQRLQVFLTAIDDLDLWKNTVIIATADHGEMGGAHGGLRGKGPMPYEENIHVPLIIAHPKAKPHSSNVALTSHIDLMPTLIGLTNLSNHTRDSQIRHFRGHDFSKLLTSNTNNIHAVREGILFTYLGVSTIDSNYLLKLLYASFMHKKTFPPLSEINYNNRGFLYVVFDGQYKYVRYFAPNALNMAENIEDIFKLNDVQLFDLKNDPHEMKNLALDKNKNATLIIKMNQLMNKLIHQEIDPKA